MQSAQFEGGHPRLVSLIQCPTKREIWSITALNAGQRNVFAEHYERS